MSGIDGVASNPALPLASFAGWASPERQWPGLCEMMEALSTEPVGPQKHDSCLVLTFRPCPLGAPRPWGTLTQSPGRTEQVEARVGQSQGPCPFPWIHLSPCSGPSQPVCSEHVPPCKAGDCGAVQILY